MGKNLNLLGRVGVIFILVAAVLVMAGGLFLPNHPMFEAFHVHAQQPGQIAVTSSNTAVIAPFASVGIVVNQPQGSSPLVKYTVLAADGATVLATPLAGQGYTFSGSFGANQTIGYLKISSGTAVFQVSGITGPAVPGVTYRGQIVVTSATSASHNFNQQFPAAPHCNATPAADPGTTQLPFWVTATNLAVTVNLHASGTGTFNVQCGADTN